MILVSDWRTEEGHNPIARKLIDSPLVFMDFVRKNLETSIHDLVDILGVKLLGDGSVARNIREQHGHDLPFTLDFGSGGQDFVGKEFWGIGLGRGVVDWRCVSSALGRFAALVAEFCPSREGASAVRAFCLQTLPAFGAKSGALTVLTTALGTFHDSNLHMKDGEGPRENCAPYGRQDTWRLLEAAFEGSLILLVARQSSSIRYG
jgi:hypothetical protein